MFRVVVKNFNAQCLLRLVSPHLYHTHTTLIHVHVTFVACYIYQNQVDYIWVTGENRIKESNGRHNNYQDTFLLRCTHIKIKV